jgi:hypothetical protein
MTRAIALIQSPLPAFALQDFARKVVVLGCAAALILAGNSLPL